MKSPVHFLVAAATLQGCVVSTNDLKPKTAADCQPFEKPCGYRCVNADDAATGCGNESCDPVDLSSDPGHCGACGHSCTVTQCVDAVCQPESLLRGGPTGDLRGIVEWKGTLYWLEGSQGGRLVSWPTSAGFSDANTTVVTTALDAGTSRTGAPSAFRIAANPALSLLYVAGSAGTLPTDNLTLWKIDPASATPAVSLFSGATAPASAKVDGIAATGDGVYFTRADAPGLFFVDAGGTALSTITTGGSPRGLAYLGSDVYYGYSASFDTLARANHAAGETVIIQGVNTLPDRLAVLQNAGITNVAFASEADGSARLLSGATVTPLYGGSGLPNPIDVASDANGVYFYDRSQGEVLEFRSDGWFFPLARGAVPFGIAVSGEYVYWTDASGAVMRVPK